MMDEIIEEQKLLIRLHGWEVKDDKSSEPREATEGDIARLMSILGA